MEQDDFRLLEAEYRAEIARLRIIAKDSLGAAGAAEHVRKEIAGTEAMNRISRTTPFRLDRAKSNITVAPTHDGDTMTANGGAFRSKGRWYALTFRCTGNGDHTQVRSLTFQVGAEIPRKRWDDLALWP